MCDSGYTTSGNHLPQGRSLALPTLVVTGPTGLRQCALDNARANAAMSIPGSLYAFMCNSGRPISGNQPAYTTSTFDSGTICCAADNCVVTGMAVSGNGALDSACAQAAMLTLGFFGYTNHRAPQVPPNQGQLLALLISVVTALTVPGNGVDTASADAATLIPGS